MADLTAAGVTILGSWSEGGVTGKRKTALQVSLVLVAAGAGTATNKIPATALGMSIIEDVTSFLKNDLTVLIPATPNVTGSEIILGGGAANAPASYTGTFLGIVKGQMAANNT
jgi:hypothetical protein